MSNVDPNIIAALVAAGTSVIILGISFIFKSFWDKYFLIFKLDQEYKYEQRKKLKEILSKSKIQLLNSCESLNFRLWNFTTHYRDKWHSVNGDYNCGGYYFTSFVYRFIVVFAWIRKIEKEMVYLDTTIATKKDMEFIKFLRLFPQVLCDVMLFSGFDYDPNVQKDHFFVHNLEHMSESIIKDDSVYIYPEFEKHFKEIQENINHACYFIDGISPDEDRLRWDRLQILHITIMIFLNTFGYDFQKTSDDKFKELIGKPRKSRLIRNFIEMIKRNKLSKQREFKHILKIIAI